MYYAPHKLQRKVEQQHERDENGDPITLPVQDKWETIGMCRCDNAGTTRLIGSDGQMYHPKYKIVFQKTPALEVGDNLRAFRMDGTLRGEGIVRVTSENNLLDYQSVYIE